MDAIKIGKFIASIRKSKKLTQIDFAKQLCISNKTVSKWEVGAGLPDVGILLTLANYLGVTVNELLAGEYIDQNIDKYKADEYTLESISYTNKQNKKITKKVIIIAIILLAITSLLWYFLTSFNTVKVYQFTFESEQFIMSDGFFMTSNMENVFQLLELEYIGEEEIDNNKLNVKLYIDNDEEDIIIYEGVYDNLYIYEDANHANYFTKDNIKMMLDNLYLDISYSDERISLNEELKIYFDHKFSNNKFFTYNSEDEIYFDASDNVKNYLITNKMDNALLNKGFSRIDIVKTIDISEIKSEDLSNTLSYSGTYEGLDIELFYYDLQYYISIFDDNENFIVFRSLTNKLLFYFDGKMIYNGILDTLVDDNMYDDHVKYYSALNYVLILIKPVIGDVA